ncbi:hypothetical protein HBB16_20540 [Pseudonocardia sp. MCCB 268]|nr:hypothetical protein [Pseudonocardia cytotoxica]
MTPALGAHRGPGGSRDARDAEEGRRCGLARLGRALRSVERSFDKRPHGRFYHEYSRDAAGRRVLEVLWEWLVQARPPRGPHSGWTGTARRLPWGLISPVLSGRAPGKATGGAGPALLRVQARPPGTPGRDSTTVCRRGRRPRRASAARVSWHEPAVAEGGSTVSRSRCTWSPTTAARTAATGPPGRRAP